MTNKEYEKARNKLIPDAVKYADGLVPGAVLSSHGGNVESKACAAWNRAYHGRMDELALGLMKGLRK